LIGRENRDASIPVVVAIVTVAMMVPVPPMPPIFICVTIVAITVPVVVVRSVLLITGVHVNAEPVICFGPGGR
jgi:hypothetical protein